MYMCGYEWVSTYDTLVMNAEETKWNKEGRYKVPEVGGGEASAEPCRQGWTRHESS